MFTLSADDLTAIRLSLQVATTATLVALPPGIAAAYFLAFSKMRGKALLEGLINLPLVLPPVVVGYLLLLLLGRNGWLGGALADLDIRVIFTLTGAIIASSVVGFPLLVRSIRIGMEDIDRHCIQAARTLGAGWWDSLITIILPLSGRAILAGMTLMFARSLGEFGATIILAGNIPGVTQTIPLAIYQYTSIPGGDRMALSLCLVSIGLSLIVLLASEAVNRNLSQQ
ncbi:molybdate ABC transporter permease subunit [Desulfofustis limnaeus]|uniref:Molybdenum transport system permease n=1 Tax=Desulfofustis limnaeus TaxID=2740163 RepID=A0ABM7W6E3_9BACT|nr:molybdate ABC transporter permease subunit [Desulfofustis limnaeus]MDX9895978.1 molybdate ABC transporter permease subunit [Desulfofustis sp.]BDD86511.1 molybdate ABC transporter permease [Desulfofustis limnaeus]